MTGRFKLVALLVVLALVAGGGLVALWSQRDDERPVTILGPWTDTQETQFEEVLRGLGVPFDYQGTAAQREVLLSQVQSGEPPDIAIMPGVGELAEYADQRRLEPLNGLYDETQYGAPWSSGRTSEHVYWVPVKADLKSIVWYRKGNEPTGGPAPLESWCIGMGDDGASGWPGSDWIEDLVLQGSGPKAYSDWVLGRDEWTDEPVLTAWKAWGELLEENPGAAERAVLTDHRGDPDRNGLLFAGWQDGCTLEHQGSFARAFYGEQEAGLTDSAALLPGGPYEVRAHEVTGDFAALFSDRPRARELIGKLASRDGQRAWATHANVFSANNAVPAKAGDVGRAIAKRLTGEEGKPRCLDASDVMAPAVRDAFYEATLLTAARAADGVDLDIPDLLRDLQRVQDAQSPTRAGLKRVCG
ncbi:extracellular solute-binding protein [Streptomyces sp. B93]|uniref:extracellular solute-binding protein n=1 Tax=Streptomyces sp. B93 TaxID=2824875 RepID=UPI001B36D20A|nr:extracellular solute-binding protein [Streptomyces sp. B93]MBQ1093238.1 extracellular solute-binding protein [Streptomyces sp. B93]